VTRKGLRPPLFRAEEPEPSLLGRLAGWLGTLKGLATTALVWAFKEQPYLLFMAVLGFVRATGTTVQTGTTGLMFSFGRAVREIPPGFRPLIPFLQIVVKVPTRSRTMDLPAQRVTTVDGLVYYVDANVVYRVVDVRKAVVEIDDLERGMRQVLGLSVQEILRVTDRSALRVGDALDGALAASMETRLDPWGVQVERAGFMSLRPSPETMRIVQLDRRVAARRRALGSLAGEGLSCPVGLPLLGEAPRTVTRRELVLSRELLSRRRRRLRRAIESVRRKHPRVLRRAQRPLLRWLLRATDMRTTVGQAWARKALGTTRRTVAPRGPGDPRGRKQGED
jgi:hypothetical protein